MFPAGHTDRRLSATHKDTKTKTQRQRHKDKDIRIMILLYIQPDLIA